MADTPESMSSSDAQNGEEYLRSLCQRYARRDGQQIIIDVPESDERALGRFLLQAVLGFFLNVHSLDDSTGVKPAVADATVESHKREAVPAPQ